ncbi:hypothetical protein UM89_19665 [Bacillus subtilis]|nr:hypothetical protein UM89_19665 [Bacillus subtilis]
MTFTPGAYESTAREKILLGFLYRSFCRIPPEPVICYRGRCFQREAASAAERNDSLIWTLCGVAGV